MTNPSGTGLGDRAYEPASVPPDEALQPGMEPEPERAQGLWAVAWHSLVRKPLFIISAVLIAVFVVMAIAPELFTSVDPHHGKLALSELPPSGTHWFGTDKLGRDVYARAVYGARPALIVGVSSAALCAIVGLIVGVLGGYFGGWLDAILARITDIFYGIPFFLGAIVMLVSLSSGNAGPVKIVGLVVLALVLFGWMQPARIVRSDAMATKYSDYVAAARSIGAGPWRIITKHILPNTIAPLLAFTTVVLGAFIGIGAALSYLGIGLHYPVVSWGVEVSDAQDDLAFAPWELLFPALFLVIAVLAFVMLGEAVREALDPKLK
jgi:oligopeptide transport system permease protein